MRLCGLDLCTCDQKVTSSNPVLSRMVSKEIKDGICVKRIPRMVM